MINIDFLSLQNIDFTNRDNLLFLAIVSFLILIILIVVILFMVKFIIILKKIIRKIFGDTNSEGRSMAVNFDSKLQGHKNINDFLQKGLPSRHQSPEGYSMALPKKENDVVENKAKSYSEKEAQNISKSLDNLKSHGASNVGVRNLGPDTEIDFRHSGTVSQKEILSDGMPTPPLPTSKSHEEAKIKDNTIFGGDAKVSRIKLQHEMRYDPKIWKEQRLAGLNLSREEREGLARKLFPSVYGRNISKSDMRWALKKMGKQLIDAKDNPKLHEKIRKEIKFVKKIGGIK